eukprot:360163-Chlamydomonas_euryale.AAC.2
MLSAQQQQQQQHAARTARTATQAVSPPTEESVLIREACYRCIGEGYNHVQGSVSFQAGPRLPFHAHRATLASPPSRVYE